MRKGERSQEKHFQINARKLNSHLTVLTRATEAFLLARAEGNDPVVAVLTSVSERELQSTVDSAKQLLRPENLDSASPDRVPLHPHETKSALPLSGTRLPGRAQE